MARKKPKLFMSEHPTLSKEYDCKNNNLPPDKISVGLSDKKIHWVCGKCGHGWKATPGSRYCNGTGCPVCAEKKRRQPRSLSYISDHPRLLEEYDRENNDLPPEEVAAGSGKKVWWICSICDHRWPASPGSRSSNNAGCPKCAGKRRNLPKKLSFVSDDPFLLKEYDPENELSLEEVAAGSGKKVWWICSICGHKWDATPYHRSRRGTGCPECAKIRRKKRFF